MNFVYTMIISVAISLSVASNSSAGFFDDLKEKTQEIERKVKSLEKKYNPKLEQKKKEVGVAPNNEKSDKVLSQNSSDSDKKNIIIKGFVYGIGTGMANQYTDSINDKYSGTVELSLKNIKSSDSEIICNNYILDEFFGFSSKEQIQKSQEYRKIIRTKPIAQLTGVRTSKVKDACFFTDIEFMADLGKNAGKKVTISPIKSTTSLLSVMGFSDITGMSLKTLSTKYLNAHTKPFILQYSKKLSGEFQKYCYRANNSYSFFQNPDFYEQAPLPQVLHRGTKVTLSNIFYANKKCYFNKLIVNKSTGKSTSQKPAKKTKKALVKKDNNEVIALKKTKNHGLFYSPDPSLKSTIEGYMLIGTINPKVTMVEIDKKSIKGSGKMRVAMFSMSDKVIPDANHSQCNSFLPDNHETLTYDPERVKKAGSKQLRYFLMHVRPSDKKGVCLYRGMVHLNPSLSTSFAKAAKLTQADVTPTSDALLKEKVDVLNLCKSNPYYPGMHTKVRCGCYSEKYANARKLFPDKTMQYAQNLIISECVNVSGFTNDYFKQCLTSGKSKTIKGFSRNDLCNCVALELEKMVSNTHVLNNNLSNLTQSAYSSCVYN